MQRRPSVTRIKLSHNFFLDEFTRSETAARHGIDIIVDIDSDVFRNLVFLCTHVLQPIRDALGPVYIVSGYRPTKVNKLVGGSRYSDHISGFAADIVVSGYTPYEVAQWIAKNIPKYHQLILEFGRWVHVSVHRGDTTPRRESLTAVKLPRRFLKPKTVYLRGLHGDELGWEHARAA